MLQHRRLPADRERELAAMGGVAPVDRPDLIPYAGDACRSGWCTFEDSVASLATLDGGHIVELGKLDGAEDSGAAGASPWRHHMRRAGRRVLMAARPRRKLIPPRSLEEMDALFHDPATRFVGRADREQVKIMYRQMCERIMRVDSEKAPWAVRWADDWVANGDPRWATRRCFSLVCAIFPTCSVGGLLAAYLTRYIGIGLVLLVLFLCIAILTLSPIFRASCAHLLWGGPRTHLFNLRAIYRLGEPLLVRKPDDKSASGSPHRSASASAPASAPAFAPAGPPHSAATAGAALTEATQEDVRLQC